MRKYRLLNNQLIEKYNQLNREVSGFIEIGRDHPQFGSQITVITGLLGDVQGFINTDVRTIKYEE